MAENSKIEWCDHTFNPWVGCLKVSPACDNCYAESWARRTGSPDLWNGKRRRTSVSNWRQPLLWNARAAAAGARERVFCASLADVFDNKAEPDWRADLWALIAATPHLNWLLLTKRPQNIAKMLPGSYVEQLVGRDLPPWPWPNVWLGTTVENQTEADRRIPHLLNVPAAIHFLSCEPLLDGVDLTHWLRAGWFPEGPSVDWVIAGGESGLGARPMYPGWAADLRDQCADAGVPFFFKQQGEFVRAAGGSLDDPFPMKRVGKKTAGRLLDGVEHNGIPGHG